MQGVINPGKTIQDHFTEEKFTHSHAPECKQYGRHRRKVALSVSKDSEYMVHTEFAISDLGPF